MDKKIPDSPCRPLTTLNSISLSKVQSSCEWSWKHPMGLLYPVTFLKASLVFWRWKFVTDRFYGQSKLFIYLFFLNGSSVLPYMTRSPPGLGTHLGQVTVFSRLIANNFWLGQSQEKKKGSPFLPRRLPNKRGPFRFPPSPPLSATTENNGAEYEELNFRSDF